MTDLLLSIAVVLVGVNAIISTYGERAREHARRVVLARLEHRCVAAEAAVKQRDALLADFSRRLVALERAGVSIPRRES